MTDLVSICIPTYNGEAFIAEAINSAIDQNYQNLEIIVSDDASKDDTLKIIESYKKRTKVPIHIFKHQPNGIGRNWNNCIKKANGKYIKFLFQDDVLNPGCIEQMVKMIKMDLTVDIIACKREFIIEESFKKDNYKVWVKLYSNLQKGLNLETYNDIFYLDSELFKSNLFFQSPLNKVGEPSTILFEKELVKKIGFFNEDLKQVLDYEFCYRVLKKSKIMIINKPLVKFRLHGNQATVINRRSNIYAEDYKIYQKIVYDKYYGLLNPNEKKILLRKYNPVVKMIYGSIDNLKRFKSKMIK